jgi:ABC-2 type transport system permease protein
LLGGLFVPLALYPSWLRTLALASPFSALLYGPGSMAFDFDPAAAARVGMKLLAWGVVLVALLASTYRRGLRVLDAHGG